MNLQNLNIDSDIALKGMLKTPPDPGALVIWNLIFGSRKNQFVSAFAANDQNLLCKYGDCYLIELELLNHVYF